MSRFNKKCVDANAEILAKSDPKGALDEDDASLVTELWMTLTKPRLVKAVKEAGGSLTQLDTKSVLVEFLLGKRTLLPVSKKRPMDDDKDNDEEDAATAKARKKDQLALDGVLGSDDSDDDDGDPTPDPYVSIGNIPISRRREVVVIVKATTRRWGHFLPQVLRRLCTCLLTLQFFPLGLLFEQDPFEEKAVKITTGITLNKKEQMRFVEPLQWLVGVSRMTELLSAVHTNLRVVLNLYRDTFLVWCWERRYSFDRIVEYERRLRLQNLGTNVDWPTTDLGLMTNFLLVASEMPRGISSSSPSYGSSNQSSSSSSSGRTSICYRWRDRKCKFGDSCRFKHACDHCSATDVHDKSKCPHWIKLQKQK
jgi:hypothetical protein